MNDLNAKLAIEVMGWSRFECDDPRDRPLGDYYSETEGGKQTLCWHWSPTTDLNQLKMCWEALSDKQKRVLQCELRSADWVLSDPVPAAELILKAKGVSL